MADEKLILDADAIQRGLTRTAHEIAEANADSKSVGLIGIQRGGVHLAGRLANFHFYLSTRGLSTHYMEVFFA